MASPPAYRIADPIIASSSPNRGLDSSPPPPPSTPPPRSASLDFHDDSPSFLGARSPPPNDPFSAHNKAGPSQHPDFGKQVPHVKHPSQPRASKRSLPVSPNLPQGASTVAGPSSRRAPSPTSRRRTAGDRRAGLGSSSNGYGSSSSDAPASNASSFRRRQDRVLGDFFGADSSEADVATSDDQLDHVPWSQPGSDAGETSTAGVGLGLGQSFQEQGSPTSGRRRLPGASSLQRQPISRTSSVTDPFGAYQGSPGSSMRDPRPSLYQNASSTSSPRQPTRQRRRLTGNSPRRASSSGRAAGHQAQSSDSEDEGIEAVVRRVAEPSSRLPESKWKKMNDYWHSRVEKVYESEKNTAIHADNQQITSIHPVVADLANYVAIEPFRSFEPTLSTSSLPLPASSSSSGSFSRHATATRASFGRTATSSHADSPFNGTPIEAPTARGSSRGKLQLFLAGNKLTCLPSALFEVGNLRVLSLWKNELTQLPPAIGDLQNLRELNVAGNQLKWLPAEMLKLRLDQFQHFPNPFVKPTAVAGAKASVVETRAVLSITGALLASQAEEEEGDEAAAAGDEDDDDDAMEADFLASQPTVLTPLAPASPGHQRGLMGPPPLPIRGGLNGGTTAAAAAAAGPSNAGLAVPRRVFDRTRSDAQVADLLSRGGGSMVNRNAASSTSSSSSSPSSGATALPPVPPSPPQLDADGDEAMLLGEDEQPAPRPPPAAAAASSSISGAAQRTRVLGPVKPLRDSTLPKLSELCLRRLLSPWEGAEDDEHGGGDESFATTVVPNGGGGGAGSSSSSSASASASPERTRRQVVWARVPSSSSAYQYRFSNGRRPTSVLESYENGALRDMDSQGQMQRGTIAALEAARRTMEGKWGSGSGITGLFGVTTRNADSWCRGVAGATDTATTTTTSMTSRESRENGGDEADASSSSSSDREDEAAPRASRTRSTSTGTGTGTGTSGIGGPSGIMDVSNELDTQGDDASLNPYFNRCPNPRHAQTHALSTQAGGPGAASHAHATGADGAAGLVDYPLSPSKSHFAPIFGAAMEQRLEWVSHIGGVKVANNGTKSATAAGEGGAVTAVDDMGLIPVLWRGCKRGCLDFLEDATS